MKPRIWCFVLCLAALVLAGCAGQLGSSSTGDTPAPSNQLTYDGAITLAIKNGQTLPGTNIAYQGKTPDGRALLVIGGQQASKSTADSVGFTGSPAPGTLVTLNTRVGTFDSSAVNLLGTIHIVVQNPQPQAGDAAPNQVTAYGMPVSYSVNLNGTLPGTTIQYLGQTPQGAQFSNAGQFPYRQQFDSVVWTGHLRDKVWLRLDLRLFSSSADSATLVGTAQVRFEQ